MTRKRGRPSKADKGPNVVEFIPRRPEPPADLTAAQRKIWKATVQGEPPEFFQGGGARRLLRCYCEHQALSDALNATIDAVDFRKAAGSSEAIARLDKLLAMHCREVRICASLLGKLRLLPSSRYGPRTAARKAEDADGDDCLPWETD